MVARVRSLREAGQSARLVKGNHEEKHGRFRRAYKAAGDKVKMKDIVASDLSCSYVSVPAGGEFATTAWEE